MGKSKRGTETAKENVIVKPAPGYVLIKNIGSCEECGHLVNEGEVVAVGDVNINHIVGHVAYFTAMSEYDIGNGIAFLEASHILGWKDEY